MGNIGDWPCKKTCYGPQLFLWDINRISPGIRIQPEAEVLDGRRRAGKSAGADFPPPSWIMVIPNMQAKVVLDIPQFNLGFLWAWVVQSCLSKPLPICRWILDGNPLEISVHGPYSIHYDVLVMVGYVKPNSLESMTEFHCRILLHSD
jgi:hypothetical protein